MKRSRHATIKAASSALLSWAFFNRMTKAELPESASLPRLAPAF
jgi:hypothetical protein